MCESMAIMVLVIINLRIDVRKRTEITYFLRFKPRLKSCPKVKVMNLFFQLLELTNLFSCNFGGSWFNSLGIIKVRFWVMILLKLHARSMFLQILDCSFEGSLIFSSQVTIVSLCYKRYFTSFLR